MVQFLNTKYPFNFKTRSFLLVYKCFWIVFFPIVILYFFKRSIKEPNYRKNLKERFGYGDSFSPGSIWIHAVSLGEFRASVPLIKELLCRNKKIILTTITPAGREEAQRVFKSELDLGIIHVAYLPLEYDFTFKLFLNRFKPQFAIILEYELWPVMISSCVRNGVPLVLAQGQYVEKSFVFDKKWSLFRGSLFNAFDLILAKSQLHKSRYEFFCNVPVETMGELRFEQEISQYQVERATAFLKKMQLKTTGRMCFCFGSTGPGEDSMLISLMRRITARAEKERIPKPFYVYVPRHKKDFKRIESQLDDSGLKFLKRANILDEKLKLKTNLLENHKKSDGLFGDSLGEINFYFQISDYVFIGNSFNDLGSHNIIEPLALKKLVVVGPSNWGIEYPIVEALESDIIKIVQNIDELYDYWWEQIVTKKNNYQLKARLEIFYKNHSGATSKCINRLEHHGFLEERT